MFPHLPSLKALHAFESAARLGSFNSAADELSVTPGAISYQIKQLESSIDNKLFHRYTRKIELTDAGTRLFRTVHQIFLQLDAEVERLSPTRSDSQLTVAVTTYFVTRWLSPRLGKFLNAHPNITVHLQHSVNDPDFTVKNSGVAIRWGNGHWDNTRLLESVSGSNSASVGGGVGGASQEADPGSNPASDLASHWRSRSELLFNLPMIAVCSPKLLTGKNAIKQPADICKHNLLYDQAGIDRWPEWFELAGIKADPDVHHPEIIDPNVRVQSAIDGHGIVLGNPLLKNDISSGALVEPFDIRLHGYGYYLLSSAEAANNNAFRLFRGWLLEEIAADTELG